MKQGRTLGVIAVFVGGLLLNLTSVYAFHFIAGGGIYSLTSNGSETSVQFQFLGVKSIPPPDELAIPAYSDYHSNVQSCIKGRACRSGCSRLVRSSTLSQLRILISIPRDPRKSHASPGRCSLRIVLGVGSNNWHFPEIAEHTEIARFEAVGMDVEEPWGRPRFLYPDHRLQCE